MAITAAVYRSGILMGSGTATAGSVTISSFTVRNDGLGGDADHTIHGGRNVQVMCTGGVSSNGVFNTRVVTDGGTSLTLADACPYT